MPFLNQAVADARESHLVPEGEYNLRIADVSIEQGKESGKDYIKTLIEIVGEGDDIEPIYHNVSLVHPDDEPKTAKFKLRMQRRFLNVFNIPFEENGFDTDDFLNAEGRCLVVQEEAQNKQQQPTGEYRHALRLPKFEGEPNDETAKEADAASGNGETRRGAKSTGRAQPAGRGGGTKRGR